MQARERERREREPNMPVLEDAVTRVASNLFRFTIQQRYQLISRRRSQVKPLVFVLVVYCYLCCSDKIVWHSVFGILYLASGIFYCRIALSIASVLLPICRLVISFYICLCFSFDLPSRVVLFVFAAVDAPSEKR